MMNALGIVIAALALWLCWSFREPALVLRAHGYVYMTRWALLSSRWCNIYIHRLDGPDPDRHLHNHPWNAVVFILWKAGPYWQKTFTSSDGYTDECIGRFNRLGATYHRIDTLTPGTWTLVITGPRRASWGFIVDGKHVDWTIYCDTIQKGVLTAEGVTSGVRL